ncbi:hypothetical protein OKW42_002707 [Paraburkholderia sp. WC7.3d]
MKFRNAENCAAVAAQSDGRCFWRGVFPQPAKALLEALQLPVLRTVKPADQPMLEVAQFERPQIERRVAAQDRFGALALFGRNEGDGRLRAQTDVARPAVRGQPELDFRAGGRVLPMSGQNETLLELSQTSTFKAAQSPCAILPPQAGTVERAMKRRFVLKRTKQHGFISSKPVQFAAGSLKLRAPASRTWRASARPCSRRPRAATRCADEAQPHRAARCDAHRQRAAHARAHAGTRRGSD